MLAIALATIFVLALWGIALGFGLPLGIPVAGTALVLAGFALRAAWKVHRRMKGGQQFERSLADQAENFEQRARPDQRPQLHDLKSQFDNALDALKSSKLAGERGGALYALPWYVIVGPPGAGKSTAIRQSGLQFPHGIQGSVRGLAGTRNCDWWLSNEAVLLDTAGRYATGDDDRAEWLAFLDLLKRAKPVRPLNGLIVALSIADLASRDEKGIADLAGQIRARLDEIIARLEVVLPVYVVFTKCDLIPGFIESFEHLTRTERTQVVGFTFASRTQGELQRRVEERWTRLAQVMERLSLVRMAEARGVDGRRLVYHFPEQLESLRDAVAAFMEATFVENVYRDAPIVRGVYLTSGTQEGSPIDRVAGSMAKGMGLAPATRAGSERADKKSYFLGDLFRTVMFPDQELARHTRRAERRAYLLKLAASVSMVMLAGAASALGLRAYLFNRELVHSVQAELGAAIGAASAQADTPVALPLLELNRQRLALLSAWGSAGPHWYQNLGFYRGNDLLPRVRSFYASTLRTVLIASLVRRIAAEIEQALERNEQLGYVPSPSEHAELYEQTRAYLLLTTPVEATQPALARELSSRLTAQLVETWVEARGEPVSAAEREAMAAHISAYLDLMRVDPKLSFARSDELVRRAREVLSRVPLTKLAVDRVVSELEPLGWELSLERMLGASGLPISATGRVRGAFTRRAWEEHVRALLDGLPRELLGDAWVLESGAQDDRTIEARGCALRAEYFGRYIDEWTRFIGTLRVEEPLEHARALSVLQDLTRGQPPPLERLMRAIAYHSRLEKPKEDKSAAEKAVEHTGILDRLTQRAKDTKVGALLAAKDPCAGGDYLSERNVRRALEGFFSFGAQAEEPAQGAAPQLTSAQIYQEQLSYVRDALQSYLDDPSAADPLIARLGGARTRVRSLIETQEVGWRPRFDALLWPPVNGASASSSAALAGEKGTQWCTSVALPFLRTLQDRYPFAKQGQDASLADLTEFYRPGSGILWAFYDASLKRNVAQIGARFELARGSDSQAMYTPELLRFLNRSFALSSALFPPRAEQPRVDFEVRVRPSPGIAQVLLEIDGKLIDFHNGPEKWVHVTWPGTGEKLGAAMRVRGAQIDETLKQEGEWGLFRLLDKGTISAQPGERFFTAQWRLHTQNDVTIDLRPARVENPFVGARSYLEAFRAEGVTVPRSITAAARPCSE